MLEMLTKSTVALLMTTAIAAAEPIVFIPEGSANAVLMVNGVTGETLKQIDGLEAVHGLSGAAGVPYLVAGSYAETDRGAIAEMAQPEGIADDEHAAHHSAPEGKPIGPVDAGVSILSVLDAATGEIVRRIEVPNYAAFGADPSVVYISNTGNGTISEVDLKRGIVRRNMVAGVGPEHIVFDAQRGVIYAADADAGNVLEVSLKDGTVARSFAIGGELHGLDLSDNQSTLFVAGRGEDKIASVSLVTGAVTVAALSPEPYHLTTIPQTGTLFVSSRAEPMVWIINAATLTATSTFQVEGEAHQMVAFR